MIKEVLKIIVLSALPVSELRGAIPYGIIKGLNPFLVFILAIFGNMLVFPIVYVFLEFFHKKFLHVNIYAKIFDKFVHRTRIKVQKNIEKWGYLGLALFVAIPFPATGAYTGALGAWIFGMDVKKAFWSISLGVIIAGIIVMVISVGGNELFVK